MRPAGLPAGTFTVHLKGSMPTPLSAFFASLYRRYDAILENVLMIPAARSAELTFEEYEVARLHDSTRDDDTAAIDTQTWRDLLAGRYLATLSGGIGIFGQQVLYRRLRAGLDDAACREHADRIAALSNDGALRDAMQEGCAPLRRARVDVARMLFAPEPVADDRWRTFAIGAVGPAFVLAVLASIAWPAGWFAAALLGFVLVATSIRYSRQVRVWEMESEALQLMLSTCTALGAREEPMLAPFRAVRSEANALRRKLARSVIVRTVPGLKEYVNWFLLGDVRDYLQGRHRVRASLPALRACFLLAANLEADIALARHLAAAPRFCWAQRHAGKELAFDNVVNPLPAAAVLDEIARHGMVIVSSHNLVLASILDHCLVPLQVSTTEGGMSLQPGVLVETNGIALLAERGFDARVQARANKVFNWLNQYLAHPAGTVEL